MILSLKRKEIFHTYDLHFRQSYLILCKIFTHLGLDRSKCVELPDQLLFCNFMNSLGQKKPAQYTIEIPITRHCNNQHEAN